MSNARNLRGGKSVNEENSEPIYLDFLKLFTNVTSNC